MAPGDADRNLLFGILALQNGFVDQDALLGAFGAWARDKSRPLAGVLVGRGAISEQEVALLEPLVDRHLRRDGGDLARGIAAVGTIEATRRSLAQLDDAELTRSLIRLGADDDRPIESPTDPDSGDTRTFVNGAGAALGGRYEVLRPHARGGLGEVFVARDAELNREVALKRIQGRYADEPQSRARFLIEAEVTGGLEHPGVVPVYGLGRSEDGRPYYAMRFIKGDSLKEAIASFHEADRRPGRDPGRRTLEFHRLLARFVGVCEAVAYAHSRGVLHRDLKPANIMLGKYGETLVVDWGLAKATGRSDPAEAERTLRPSPASGSAETLPGSAFGTPEYMSPEQAAGRPDLLGPASDVYSLGATLYAMLTGHAAFRGPDCGTMLQQVRRGEFPAPRSENPTVPPALEAVCLKAMALRPSDRYESAQALARDVQRWLADEPVEACPEPLWSRGRRWMRRHRVAMAAASTALVLVTVGLAIGLVREASSRRRIEAINLKLRETNARLVDANAREKRAKEQERARFDLARKAIEAYYKGASEDVLLRQPEFEALRSKLLRSALDFYRELTSVLETGGEEDPEVRSVLAAAYGDLGDLTDRIGSKADALAGYERAADLYEQLCRSRPGDAELRSRLASMQQDVASVRAAIGQVPEALRLQERASQILAELSAADPRNAKYRRLLAVGLARSGRWIGERGRIAEGLDDLRKAAAILDELVTSDPGDLGSLASLAACHSSMALLHTRSARSGEDAPLGARMTSLFAGLREAEKVVEINEKVSAARPDEPMSRKNLAASYNNLAVMLSETGRYAEASDPYRRARDQYKALSSAHPTVTGFRQDWVATQCNMGMNLLPTGRPAEALELAREALPVAQGLVAANPLVASHRATLAYLHRLKGRAYGDLRRPTEAIGAYRDALPVARAILREDPDNAAHRRGLDELLQELAAAYLASRRTAEAASATLERRALCPGEPEGLASVASSLAGIAGAVGRGKAEGDLTDAERAERREYADRAMEALRRAIAAGFHDPRRLARDTNFGPLRARDDFRALFGGDANFPPIPFVGDHFFEADAIEGESLRGVSVTTGDVRPQDMSVFGDGWSAGQQLWWSVAGPGGELRIVVPVESAGTFDLSVGLTRSFDYGIATLTLDGRSLGGPLDLYSPSVVPTGSISLGRVALGPGPHRLTVRIDRKNGKSIGYFFGLDWIKLKPVP